jgi:soluble lytic murein transglycosylase
VICPEGRARSLRERFVKVATGMKLHTLLAPLLFSAIVGCAAPQGVAEEHRGGVESLPRPVAEVDWGHDPEVQRARAALEEGRPWRASRLLAPILADPRRRTPESVLLASLAAAEWEGWSEVHRLLNGERWVDSLFDGSARVLLVRAALARNADEEATRHAERAVASAANPAQRGERLVLLARALDRRRIFDSAATLYAESAGILERGADWLYLRAAAIDSSPTQRATWLQRVSIPVARDRAGLTEGLARERTGDRAGAIRAYEEAGVRIPALRLRLLEPGADRAGIRRALFAVVTGEPGSTDARTAVELLDASFAPLTPAEELSVARSAARAGPAARAATAYGRALAGGQGTAEDRLAYGRLLLRLGRGSEAEQQLARVTAPAPLAAAARYERARAQVRAGRVSEGRTQLRALLRDFPQDTSSATALLLLGDLAVDEGRDGAAREAFRDLARRFPQSRHASTARFRAAIIAYAEGNRRAAVAEMDSIVLVQPRGSEAYAAGYWSGRIHAELGDSARARERWRAVLSAEPLSYYGGVSARRLGQEPWAPPAAPDSFVRFGDLDAALQRATLLERLGMDFEARLEFDRLDRDAGTSAERLLATAHAFRERGMASRGIQLARRAQSAGAPADARLYRLLYPVVHRDVLVAEAREHRLDPPLVAGLIRQESHFNPRATSPAGALGLMQVMPGVGAQLARGANFPYWDVALLYQPDVSMQLGTRHLADAVARYPELVHVLAAYNAGGSRVARWRERAGANDVEVFIERIPFVETRDYVRIVQRNADLYRALYTW